MRNSIQGLIERTEDIREKAFLLTCMLTPEQKIEAVARLKEWRRLRYPANWLIHGEGLDKGRGVIVDCGAI